MAKTSKMGQLILQDDTAVPIEATSHATRGQYLDRDWPGIDSPAKILAVMRTAADAANEKLFARPYDFSDWFRMLAPLPKDRWKAQFVFADSHYDDCCV